MKEVNKRLRYVVLRTRVCTYVELRNLQNSLESEDWQVYNRVYVLISSTTQVWDKDSPTCSCWLKVVHNSPLLDEKGSYPISAHVDDSVKTCARTILSIGRCFNGKSWYPQGYGMKWHVCWLQGEYVAKGKDSRYSCGLITTGYLKSLPLVSPKRMLLRYNISNNIR